MAALRAAPAGLTLTELRDLDHRHRGGQELVRDLEARGYRLTVTQATDGGRPASRVRLAEAAAA